VVEASIFFDRAARLSRSVLPDLPASTAWMGDDLPSATAVTATMLAAITASS
jgi:hypothetical protein